MARYRQRLRDEGLRPVQIWVPDTRNPSFLKQLKQDVASLSHPHEKKALEFIEQASDFDGWQ